MTNPAKIAVLLAMLNVQACEWRGDEANAEAADVVITGGTIYTVDATNLWAEAVAIEGDRFVYVGDDAGAEKFVDDSTERFDLGGRFVLPGLIDGHTHPGLFGIEKYGSLPDSSREEFLAGLEEYADANPDEEWLRMCCWPNHLYVDGSKGPHRRELDAVVADRPVWITSSSWHSYWLNSKALEALGVGAETPDPRPGIAVFYRDESGDLTGWVKEGAGWQFFPTIFEVDKDIHRKSVEAFLRTLSEYGVTTVYDGGNIGYEDEVYGLLSQLESEGKLPLRYEGTTAIFTPDRRDTAVSEMKRLREAYGGERLRFRTIKLFMDGINENHSGSMLEPYVNDDRYVANTMLTVDELREFLIELHEDKFDLHIHVIGDRAVRTALDGVEAARDLVGSEFYPRVTLAHLQSIDPADYARFGELGVSANFTAWWHGVDYDDPTELALGPERFSRTYTAKPLFDSGGNVTFSSDDWRLEVLSPFLGIQVGHTRQYPLEFLGEQNVDREAFKPPASEKLDVELMIQGYTINGAYPFRMEDEIGSIEEGKLADLVVLEQNLFEMDTQAIHMVKPAAVMVEGEFVHGAIH